MAPAKPDFYRDVLQDEDIKPATIGGMWYPKLYNAEEDVAKNVVLHFHGGAYVLGGCRPKKGGWGPEILAKSISGLVLCPQYRLASNPNGRFPASLQDAVTSYQYLLGLGIPHSRIIISGDSAGGNLVVVLLRYFSDHPNLLPNPLAALLWSPWLDLAANADAVDRHRHSKNDFVTSSLLKWALRVYKPPFMAANHPYLSPHSNEFATPVPMFMQCGTVEILHDEQISFMTQMTGIPGNEFELLELVNAPHNTFLAGKILGFEKEAKKAADAASAFIEAQKTGKAIF